MTTIPIRTKQPYDVEILRPGDSVAERVRALCGTDRRFAIVTDSTVNALYGSKLEEALPGSFRLVFPPGESTKTFACLEEGLTLLSLEGFTKRDVILAFGGGVIGDLAGFLAATCRRGVDLIQIPTTLLACADASVGGKTAVDLKTGRNLAGVFWQPKGVLIQPAFLASLPEHRRKDGLAEILKCGILAGPDLFGKVRTADLPELIEEAVRVKAALVAEDERDAGKRQLLNLGHTLGHALEAATRYEVPHGHAVAFGLARTTLAAKELGWCDPKTAEEIIGAVRELGFPLTYDVSEEDLFRFALQDKKRSGGTMTLVIPEAVGRCALKPVSLDGFRRFVSFAMGRIMEP